MALNDRKSPKLYYIPNTSDTESPSFELEDLVELNFIYQFADQVYFYDYDKDGDQDIMINNNGQAPTFYCNHGNTNSFISVKLGETGNNTQALGARVYVTVGETTQMREIHAGNTYVSQNPTDAHFGLGGTSEVDLIRIVWSDGAYTEINDVDANQYLTVERN